MDRNDGKLMKIPRKIKVGAYTYIVKRKKTIKEDNQELLGLCDRGAHLIYIVKDLSDKKAKEVLLHECLHAIEESYGINLGENKVNLLGLALLALIDDNKLEF